MRRTQAVTHVRRCEANHAKIEALNARATAYLGRCQQYTSYFCTAAQPEKYAAPGFDRPLAQRGQRVAIQHAAGSARSWRSNYAIAHQEYLDRLAEDQEAPEGASPIWKEWHPPVLDEAVIQANATGAVLPPADDSRFDYWRRLSTLEKGQPVLLPVKLAPYEIVR
jgi:hypothetical protein